MAYARKEKSATVAPLRFVNDLSKIPFFREFGFNNLIHYYVFVCLNCSSVGFIAMSLQRLS